MKTEAEAKKCWCPFAMTFGRLSHYRDDEPIGTSYGPQNRGATMGGKLDTCLCIASECMAWRMAETPEFKASADDHFHKTGRRLQSDTGYCGLAGKP